MTEITTTIDTEEIKGLATRALDDLDRQIVETREIKRQAQAKIKRLLAERAEMNRIVTATSPRRSKVQANGDG